MKTGVSYSAKGGMTEIGAHMERLRRIGFDCMDLQAFADTETAWFSCPSAEFERRCREVRRMADACGLEISQTHGPWRWPPRDFEPEDRAERFDKMARSLEGTAAAGAPCMAIHCIMPLGKYFPDMRRFCVLLTASANISAKFPSNFVAFGSQCVWKCLIASHLYFSSCQCDGSSFLYALITASSFALSNDISSFMNVPCHACVDQQKRAAK